MPRHDHSLPTDLTLPGDRELDRLHVEAVVEFDQLALSREFTFETVARQEQLADYIDRIRVELAKRRATANYLKRAAARRREVDRQADSVRDVLYEWVHGSRRWPGDR
jgi:hypothetical protein